MPKGSGAVNPGACFRRSFRNFRILGLEFRVGLGVNTQNPPGP